MESPVPKAAAMIRVLTMMPKMIRAVWDLRRGMLRSPSLSITRLRQPMTATPAIAGRKTASRPNMMMSMDRPNSSSIVVLVVDYPAGNYRLLLLTGELAVAVVYDLAVTHADDAVGPVAHVH